MLENDNKIEDIKRRLYEPKDTVTHRSKEGVLHSIKHKVDEEWRHEEKSKTSNDNMKKPRISIFKKFFIVSIFLFIGALIFSLYMFSTNSASVSNDNIDITVIGNAFAKGGEELPLQIEVTNRNKASLELSKLIISYPSGATDDAIDYIRLPQVSVGEIKPGETITKNIKVVLFGEERSNRNIKISLEYHPEGSNAIFSKETNYVVNISSAPISLFMDIPETVTSDQPITINVKATLNTSLPDGDTVLQLTYPNNFVFESASPLPSFGNSMWSLSSLSLTNPITIAVSGRIIGQDQDQQVFRVHAGISKPTNKSTVEVIYNSLVRSVTIVKPFLEANILVDNTASSGENMNVRIAWANNLPTRITDGEIIVSIGGNAFDRFSVRSSNGFFDSSNNRIIWDKNSNRDLGDIEPGEKGEVSFTVKSIPLVGTQSTIKEPQVTFDVSVRGRQPSLGSTYTDINNFSKKIVKILSDFQIVSSASFKTGAFPPKAENETRYNITWTLLNGTNTISNAVARASLPIYVNWVESTSPRENINYNEATREVIWNIGSVRANTGGSYTREGNFTIALNPSISQVGSIPQLMKEVYISGTDLFTGTIINNKYMSINTLLSGDPNFKSGYDRVVQ